jgi:Colicin V production protein
MNPQVESTAGSPVWQLAFLSFALALIAYEMVRGWRSGLGRQLARFAAVVAAYLAAFYGGTFVGPLLQPLVNLPDALLSVLGGALLALAVYAVINSLGVVAFKRTSEHQSAALRLVYGSTGAVLGFSFGVFLMFLLVIGVRSLGAIADGEVRQKTAEAAVAHTVDMRIGVPARPASDSSGLTTLLARLKNSLEFGVIGDAVRRVDVVPAKIYDDLDKLGQVASDRQTAERFLSFPGARQLSENPRIIALRNDREIAELISRGRFVDLVRNEKIVQTFNDPVILEQIKRFDIDAALDYALQRN